MPYAHRQIGIYRIANSVTGECYIGQSRNVKKRFADHFCLLRKGEHPNLNLQGSYASHGPDAFFAELEVECADVQDLSDIEDSFLKGEAVFESDKLFNIATDSKAVMKGRLHTESSKKQISQSRKGQVDHITPEYRSKLSLAQQQRHLADPEFKEKLKFILENPQLSYAERARRVGSDTSSVRKKAIKYKHLLGEIE